MATYKATSWGRTRSPKNILSKFRTGTNASGDGLTLDGTSSAYVTENQRFLIVQITTFDTSFKVQGFMHASGTFSDLKGGPTINDAGIWIVDISGIDQVKFVTGGSNVFFAACSTF